MVPLVLLFITEQGSVKVIIGLYIFCLFSLPY